MKRATESEQSLRSNFFFPALDIRQITLIDADPLSKLILRHIKSTKFADPSANGFPVN